MAPGISANATATLKAITYRLTSATPEQLPLLATQVSGSIWNCRDILSASADFLGSKNETTQLVHRFRTRVTSLLQDRTIEGRWAAVVLTKAAVEAGGVESLSKSNAWVRSLLAILKRSDPSTTRCLAVVTLTRIFMLTWEYSNLIREITTPALPGFISACLANAKKERCSANELGTILEAFATLVPKHPTIFRTHEAQITAVVNEVLSSGSAASQAYHAQSTKAIACRVKVSLHHCAPKQGGSDQWDRTFQASIAALHTTCDRLFRSTTEDWDSVAGMQKSANSTMLSTSEAELDTEDELSLGPWSGIIAGRDRLTTIVGLLIAHLETSTSSSVPLRVGLLIDALTRVLSLTTTAVTNPAKINAQVSREEREVLSAILPSVHVAAVELVQSLLQRFGAASISLTQSLGELISDVYRAEALDDQVRGAAYNCQELMLQLYGPSLPKESVAELTVLMRGCCNDLLPDEASTAQSNGSLSGLQPDSKQINGDGKRSTKSSTLSRRNDATKAASGLLATFITKVNPAYVPRKLRTQIERTAILTRNKNALLACIMNPTQKDVGAKLQTSLLPFLAREYPNAPEVEALLRPRMKPVTLQKAAGPQDDFEVDDEDGSEEDGTDADRSNGSLQQEGGVTTVDDDPTTSLFDALTQPSNPTSDQEEQDELYATTPPRPQDFVVATAGVAGQVDSINSPQLAAKRAADFESLDAEVPTKRRRGSPAHEAVVEGPASALLGLDPVSVDTALPIAVALGRNGRGQAEGTTVVAQQPAVNSLLSETTRDTGAGGDVDSDGSEFEIPHLTMESDTEAEEEEEEET